MGETVSWLIGGKCYYSCGVSLIEPMNVMNRSDHKILCKEIKLKLRMKEAEEKKIIDNALSQSMSGISLEEVQANSNSESDGEKEDLTNEVKVDDNTALDNSPKELKNTADIENDID